MQSTCTLLRCHYHRYPFRHRCTRRLLTLSIAKALRTALCLSRPHLLLQKLQGQLRSLVLALGHSLAPLAGLHLAGRLLLASWLIPSTAIRPTGAPSRMALVRAAGQRRVAQRVAVLLRLLHHNQLPTVLLLLLLHLNQLPAGCICLRRKPAGPAACVCIAELQCWRRTSAAAAPAARLRQAVKQMAKRLKAAVQQRQGSRCNWVPASNTWLDAKDAQHCHSSRNCNKPPAPHPAACTAGAANRPPSPQLRAGCHLINLGHPPLLLSMVPS